VIVCPLVTGRTHDIPIEPLFGVAVILVGGPTSTGSIVVEVLVIKLQHGP
jgi:hypothetical protein